MECIEIADTVISSNNDSHNDGMEPNVDKRKTAAASCVYLAGNKQILNDVALTSS